LNWIQSYKTWLTRRSISILRHVTRF